MYAQTKMETGVFTSHKVKLKPNVLKVRGLVLDGHRHSQFSMMLNHNGFLELTEIFFCKQINYVWDKECNGH